MRQNYTYNLFYSFIMDDIRPIVTVQLMGGLGNQMFQIACAYAYAKQQNGRLQLANHKKVPDGRPMYWDSVLYAFAPFVTDSHPGKLSHWREYCETIYSPIPPLPANGLSIFGYLQSSKYFHAYRDEIRNMMKARPELCKMIQSNYSDIFRIQDRVVIVHARRTDYLDSYDRIQVHGPLNDDYYKRAIESMCTHVNDPFFVLCSDDSAYWDHLIESIPILKNSMVLMNETDVNTFALFQQFSYFIMANSTFSWWGVFLADSKHVICPKTWFGPKGPRNYEDIYESSWQRI
jgi:hypothetical protein